jgi:predicted acylesterase/phospholipase RssA/CRP-like cAMP-binding protein
LSTTDIATVVQDSSDDLALQMVRQLVVQNASQFLRVIEDRTSMAATESLEIVRQFLARGEQSGSTAAAPLSRLPSTVARIESYASIWSSVIPAHTELRGVTSLLLETRYATDLAGLPQTTAALSLDNPEVLAARADFAELAPDRDGLEDVLGRIPDAQPDGGPTELELAIEAEMRLQRLAKGEVLCRQGDAADCFYLLLSGRLGVFVTEASGEPQLFAEVSPGETAGETEVLTNEARPATIRAVRDSVVIVLGNEACQGLIERYPRFLLAVTKVVIHRLRDLQSSNPHSRRAPLRTIAVLPVGQSVPARRFAASLARAFGTRGTASHVTREAAESALEEAPETLVADTYDDRLVSWVSEQEARYRFTVYEAEPELNAWTKRCLRQADRVMLVAFSSDDPGLSPVESVAAESLQGDLLDGAELVLLQDSTVAHPTGTQAWLEARNISDHHHVRLDNDDDFGHLVRRLTGHALGVVMGGGGARAFAAIGALQAIDEAGLPIDLLGGTSAGSFMAAGYALGWDSKDMVEIARSTMGSKRQTLDYTLPLVSLMSASKMKRTLQALFGSTRIEDLWRPYFCISSNVTRAEMMVHRSGLLWHYVRASCSIPTVFPPVLDGNDLLVDGMLLNNLPVETMSEISHGGPVIAVDVSAKEDVYQEFRFGASLSAMQVILGRLHPNKQRRIKAPSILQMILRTSEVASIYARKAQAKHATVYVAPPVSQFGVFDMSVSAIDQLVELGYERTRIELESWFERSPEARSYRK